MSEDKRHPSTEHMLRMLVTNPNLPPRLRHIATICEETATDLVQDIPDGPELTAGLRKLLEAKDCFVRACL